MKQFGASLNDTIFGGALAMADSLASCSDGKENAFRYLLASDGFFATPLWFVLMVVIQRFVAVL
jgi:hypothetical protein